MSFMDMLGGASGGQGSLLSSLTGLIGDHPGGLNGLVDQLRAAGLSKQVDSWVGTGTNLPVSADQLKAALGSDKIKEIAEATGLSHHDAANGLAEHLPDLINKLTPNGSIPQGDLKEQAFALLKSKFFGG